jgi:hypothetical protein
LATHSRDAILADIRGRLATFRSVSGETFTRALSLAQDLATVFGSDLSSATTVFMTVNAPDAESFRKSENQLAGELAVRLARAKHRNT